MTEYYRMELDIPTHSFHMVCEGMWTHAVIDDYERDMGRTLERYRVAGGKPHTLLSMIDLRKGVIQKQDIAQRLGELDVRYSTASERIAMLLSHSALQRVQMKRIAFSEKHRIFTEQAEAQEWLDQARLSYSLAG